METLVRIAHSDAEALFSELRGVLVNAERIVIEIIEKRAWEPLGYRSFAEAWNDRMAGCRLATHAVKAAVVYALLETESDDEIADMVGGITPSIAGALREQKADGVPPNRTVVRRHHRSNPSRPRTIHVTVTEFEYARWSRRAKAEGTTLEAEVAALLRNHFRETCQASS